MSPQLNFTTLEKTCDMYSCTEIDGKTTYVCALAPNLSEVASWLRENQSFYLILCADTLIIDEDEILPVSTAVQIAARNILVRKKGSATITIDSSEEVTGLEICTQGVLGSLKAGFQRIKQKPLRCPVQRRPYSPGQKAEN